MRKRSEVTMDTEARDAEIQEAFREAFEKLDAVKGSLERLRKMMEVDNDDILGEADSGFPELQKGTGNRAG